MSKTRAYSLAREWLTDHPEGALESEAFRSWCADRGLDAAGVREVRVAVIRARYFGRAA
jgi:hypothetical protein